ncbi:MAG: hypothetical protein NUV47_01180 [Patescibacteria group bacterium]|nr:hypothetical protein [Patescibacteria group bacterium]
MKPYLIQRAKFQDNFDKESIDSILGFDYMGSAEFEFGALSQSLKRIREQISEYRTFSAVGVPLNHPLNVSNDFKITIFCNGNNHKEICQAVKNLADNKFHLKEYCDFSDWIHSKKNYRNSDFWWDIENDYMFWKYNLEFNTKFEKLIRKGNRNG